MSDRRKVEIAASRFVYTPEGALSCVVDNFIKGYPEYAEDLEQAFFSWPNLEDAVRRAAFFVSPALPSAEDDRRSLFGRALRNGVLASNRLAGCEMFAPFLGAFLKTLADGFAGLLVYGLAGDGSQEKWEMCGPNLCQWAASFDTVVILKNEPKLNESLSRASAILLAARILNAVDLALCLDQSSESPPLFSSLPTFDRP